MKNVQVTIDEATVRQIDQVGKPLGLKRSEIIRRALKDWLHRQAAEGFERGWIDSLQRRPDKAVRSEEWVGVQAWSEK